MPLGTVQKIFSGQTKSPRYGTLRALEKMFLEVTGENRREGSLADTRDRLPADGQGTTIYKAGASRDKYDGWRGKKQGEFTLEDYYALPDDQRADYPASSENIRRPNKISCCTAQPLYDIIYGLRQAAVRFWCAAADALSLRKR